MDIGTTHMLLPNVWSQDKVPVPQSLANERDDAGSRRPELAPGMTGSRTFSPFKFSNLNVHLPLNGRFSPNMPFPNRLVNDKIAGHSHYMINTTACSQNKPFTLFTITAP
jgi:hypothetical protein